MQYFGYHFMFSVFVRNAIGRGVSSINTPRALVNLVFVLL
jgi:hypothetical protein